MPLRTNGLAVLAITTLLAVKGAEATVQRTFVASTGNDANACSLVAPCRGFTAAVTQTSPGGEVIVLDSAGYGVVTITKSVSLIAPAGIYAGVSVSSGDGITVNAPGAVVVLRGLAINGQGGQRGIHLQNAARLRVEACVISRMSGDGIAHSAPNAELIVLDSIIRDNGGFGLNVTADTSITLDHVRSEHNQASGLGLVGVSSEANATITDSIFSHNGGNGIVADAPAGTKTFITVERSAMSSNVGAGFWATTLNAGAKVYATLMRDVINRNGADGVLLTGTSPGYVNATLGANAIQGNMGDGIGAHGASNAAAGENSIGPNTGYSLSCDSGFVFRTQGNNIGDNNTNSVFSCLFTDVGF
jgi:hypothetical protein